MQRNSSVVRRYRSMPFMFGLMAMLLAGVLALTGCSGDESEAVSEISGNIVISEVMSTNSYYLPLADGSCHDWIEFHNISQSAVNLKGCMLSDKARTANKWKVMTDLVIQPGGYGLIILSGLDKVDEQGYIHANFKLSSKGENLIFSDPSGSVIQQLEVPECTMRNISYGLPDGAEEYLWYAEPTPGSANAGNTSAVPDQLVFPKSGLLINEYMTKNTYVIYDSQSRYCDWIEIYNSTAETAMRRSIFFCFLFMIILSIKNSRKGLTDCPLRLQALKFDFAVGLDLAAGFEHVLHDRFGLGPVLKFHGHFEGHEAHHCVLDTGGLLRRLLHEVCAVGAVHFDLVALFHIRSSCQNRFRLSSCLIFMTGV